jgi:molecular chaperone HscB
MATFPYWMMQNYFELFSLKVDFAIDLSALEHTYQTQIAQYHPDKFATADDKKKVTAIQNTSLPVCLIAYKTSIL